MEDLQALAASLSPVNVAALSANAEPSGLSDHASQDPSRLTQLVLQPSQGDLDQLEQALGHISSDVPRGVGNIIGPDRQPVRDYWFGVILAARRKFGDAAKEALRRWSQQSARYTDVGFEKDWAAFDPSHANPVTIGSVFMLAKACGWQNNGTPDEPAELAQWAKDTCRFKLLDRSAIMATKPISWRLKGILPETGLAAVYGPSGSGKSFLAIDMGITIALGQQWFGHRSTACAVAYVMLEGEAGLRNRIEAWEKHNESKIPAQFGAIAQPVDLTKDDDVRDLAQAVPQGGVTIIDTLNRAAPGLDENASQDMGRMITAMKRLQVDTGGLVLFVHHTGKDTSKGLRGHSSLHAAIDAAVEVSRSGTDRSWSVAKAKDGADGEDKAFRLEVVDLGKDSDGDSMTSCAVGPDTAAVFARPEPSGIRQKQALKAIRRALPQSSDLGRAQCGPDVPCIAVEDAIDAIAATLTTESKNKRRNRARSILQGLIDRSYIRSGQDEQEDGWVWE